MFKRLGVFALMLSGVMGALLPATALAQDGYDGRRNYYQSDRNWDRHQGREWREHEREARRAEEWRERQWRNHEWREREWREHERSEHRFNRPYYGYGR
jgi:hypothetical protein